jgi:hypothetical protein
MTFKSLLEVVQACDKYPYETESSSTGNVHNPTPFILGPHKIGNVLPKVLPALVQYNEREHEKTPFEITEKAITFSAWVNTPELRTTVMKQLMDTWREEKVFPVLEGWRNELYPIYGDLNQPDNVAFVMERASTPLFGISTFGVHLNAYTKNEEGEIFMWVARRALTKPTYPGLLDNCVRYRMLF